MSKTLGLDLGVASIGWALFDNDADDNPSRIIDLGSFVFNQIENGKTGKLDNVNRRLKRGQRRLRRRKNYRLKEARYLFKNEFGISDEEFFEICKNNKIDVLELKVKGISSILTKEELCIVLYNYMKYRGFKSSRKNQDKETEGALLNKISSFKKELNGSGCDYASQLLLKNYSSKDIKDKRYHNHDKDYLLTIDRGLYLEEINAILDKQIQFGLINKKFKDDYLFVYNKQRLYSQGPDGRYSEYGSDRTKESLINRMRGKCAFKGYENEYCSPKDSFSATSFVLLSSLNNIYMKNEDIVDNEYLVRINENQNKINTYRLNEKGIKLCYDKAIVSDSFNYLQLLKLLGIDPGKISFKGLFLSKKEYNNVLNKFLKTHEDLKNKKSYDWSAEETESFDLLCEKKKLESNIFKQPSSKLVKLTYQLFNDLEREDKINDISEILLDNKSDDLIIKTLKEHKYSETVIKTIIDEVGDVKNTINLSTRLCSELNKLLLNGMTYDKAMNNLGLNHSERNLRDNIHGGRIPDIDTALKENFIQLRNPVVRNTLIQLRKLLNSIVDVYGDIDFFSIEVLRDLKRNFQDRMSLRNEQFENMENNIEIKSEIMSNFSSIFGSISMIKRDDVIKYKLYKEQKGRSAYTNNPIEIKYLFNNGYYEIDHIWPYSRTFDDNFTNKVLVETKQNRDKGNKIPREYLHNDSIIKEFLNQANVSKVKADRLLAHELPENSEFKLRDKNDSSYIAKLAKKLILFYLVKGNDENCQTQSGVITDKLKTFWRLKGKTHSYLSSFEKNYSAEYCYIFNDVIIDSDKLVFEFISNRNSVMDEKINFEYTKYKKKNEVKVNENDEENQERGLSYYQQQSNEYLSEIINNKELVYSVLSKYFNKKPEDIAGSLVENHLLNDNLRESVIYFFNKNIAGCQKNHLTKDRSNDLHHALDACIIACCTPTNVAKITKWYKNEEINDVFYNKTTGEVNKVPYPYDSFFKEVLLRVYERDESKLKTELFKLSNYKNIDTKEKESIHVLWPTRLPNKISKDGICLDTIYGEKNGNATSKISVHKLSLKNEEIDKKIININHGQDKIIEVIRNWLALDKKDRTPYPVLIKKGRDGKDVSNYIKTVKIDLGNVNNYYKLGEKRYASNNDFAITRIYKKRDGSDLEYYCSMNYGTLYKERKHSNSIYYDLRFGQSNKFIKVNKSTIDDENLLKSQFNRYSLLEIKLKGSVSSAFVYAGCASSGRLEVYSILGDQADLINKGIIRILKLQVLLTVSCIEYIKIHNISVLGRIS